MTPIDPPLTPSPIKTALARVKQLAIPDRGALALDLTFKAGRESIILTRQGDKIGVFANKCPHARWPLDTFDGRFLFTQDGALICAAHSAVFDPVSGDCLGGPGTGTGLTRIEHEIEGDEVVVFDAS